MTGSPGAAASDVDPRVLRRYAGYVDAAAVVLVCLGSGVLAGWAWRVDRLTTVLPGTASMRPNTAVCLVASGLALWLGRAGTPPRWRRLGGCAAASVVLITTGTLAEYAAGVSPGLDTILFGADPGLAIQRYPGRMAPHTALGLLFLGAAQLVLPGPPAVSGARVVTGQVLSLAAGAVGVLGLYGHAYAVPEFQNPLGLTAMAVHTALAITVGAIGSFVARPAVGLARILTTRARTAMMTRRILLAALFVPPGLGWLRVLGENRDLYGTELGVALLVAVNVTIFVVLLFATGAAAVRLEARHRRAEAELAWHSAAAAMAEAAPDAMVGVDNDGTVVLVNAEAERLFGYPRAEMLGRPVEVFVPPGVHPADPHRATGGVLCVRRKDGAEIPTQISVSALHTGGRRLVVAAVHDVSDRIRYETQLREKNAQLQQANQAKDAFLAAMSHELRTPLNSIIGFTGTLLMGLPGPVNDEQAHQLRLVETAGQHLLCLIDDILQLAKIEAGQLDLHPEPTDCGATVQEVTEYMRPLADHKGLPLITDLPEQTCTATVDRRALSQILINLIGNAIKFTDAGHVHVGLTRDQPRTPWTVTISDTGPGIDPAEHTRIFEAFHRAATARHHDGTGLGLFICHTLAERMACPIRLTSSPGEGTTVTLVLPE